MRKICTIIICFCCCYASFSQSISPYVISSKGEYFSNSSSSLSWTLGQIASTSLFTPDNILTQGFQQPYYYDPSDIPVINDDSFEIQIYPNPVRDFINIIYSTQTKTKLKFEVLDLLGNNLKPYIEKDSEIVPKKLELRIDELKPGIYLVRIISKSSDILKTFKIIKIE